MDDRHDAMTTTGSFNPLKTLLLPASQPGSITTAGRLLRRGQLVVYPTDTLYGVGAAAFDPAAIAALYAVKERPLAKGLPILLADAQALDRVARAVPAVAQPLIDRFWPGPLTLILPRRADLPANISPNDGIAVRVPDHAVSRAIIAAAGGAVATSSANLSGAPSARTAAAALAMLDSRVAAIVDDGPSPRGEASTILDCTCDPPRLIRPGPVSADQLPLAV